MAQIDVSASNTFFIGQSATVFNGKGLPIYGSVVDADSYFEFHLVPEAWFEADRRRQVAALSQATRIVDSLNYAGQKTSVLQFNEFPRNGDVEVPQKIILATYEIALKLLEGFEPDREVDNLAKTGQGYGGVRSNFGRDFALEHIAAGIPSQMAWKYIRPYLLDPQRISIRRSG